LSKIAENSYRKDNDDSIEDVNDNDNTPVEEVDEENYQSIMRM
jgi:hypothetical protein